MSKQHRLDQELLKTLVSTAEGVGGDFLPTPLAATFIEYVRELNFLRQAFNVVPMESKTRDYPKVLGGTKVYYQPTEGGAALQTGFTTGSLQLEAKKFMAQINLSEEVIEDAAFNMEAIVQDHFGAQLAEAEEEAMIVGNPAHATTPTEGAATEINWFNRDHRLIWYGLLTLAGDIAGVINDDTRAANRVNVAGAQLSTAHLRQALFNMGKYGRRMSDIVAIVNPWAANTLLDDPKLVTLEKYGPNATIFTGEFGKLYGKITMINSAFMTDTFGVVTHRANPILGDRRRVSIKSDSDITSDSRLFVLTERADFLVQYKGALVQLFDIEAASDES